MLKFKFFLLVTLALCAGTHSARADILLHLSDNPNVKIALNGSVAEEIRGDIKTITEPLYPRRDDSDNRLVAVWVLENSDLLNLDKVKWLSRTIPARMVECSTFVCDNSDILFIVPSQDHLPPELRTSADSPFCVFAKGVSGQYQIPPGRTCVSTEFLNSAIEFHIAFLAGHTWSGGQGKLFQ